MKPNNLLAESLDSSFSGKAHTGAPGFRLRFSMGRTLNQPKVRGCFSLSARPMEVCAGSPPPVVVLMKQGG